MWKLTGTVSHNEPMLSLVDCVLSINFTFEEMFPVLRRSSRSLTLLVPHESQLPKGLTNCSFQFPFWLKLQIIVSKPKRQKSSTTMMRQKRKIHEFSLVELSWSFKITFGGIEGAITRVCLA